MTYFAIGYKSIIAVPFNDARLACSSFTNYDHLNYCSVLEELENSKSPVWLTWSISRVLHVGAAQKFEGKE